MSMGGDYVSELWLKGAYYSSSRLYMSMEQQWWNNTDRGKPNSFSGF
jgi:hypothetical protein